MLDITTVDHIALPVSDLDQAVAFYTEVMGLRIVREMRNPAPPTTPHVDLEAGQVHLSVFLALDPGEDTPRKNLSKVSQFPHVAFQVKDAAGALDRLKASGYPFDGPIPRSSGRAEVYLWDPDGNQLEFTMPWPATATS
jgi:catechol 2,3-dioxygenase-like lactoylglutathione lyase family enzyme